MKLLLSLLFLLTALVSQSQEMETNIQTTALFGSHDALPFWMTHNQLGRYASSANAQGLTEAMVSGSAPWPGKLTLSYGTDLALLIAGKDIDPKVIEAWAGLTSPLLRLQAGAFAEPEEMEGLSSSNGDLLRSLNHRPYPRVRLSTPGFIALPLAQKWLRVNAQYDEGILTGERVVEQPHLHHKSLLLQWLAKPTLRFTMGIHHYVFWGGHSPTLGELPHRFNDYIRYVTGQAGGKGFSTPEQLNVAGNQLGDYLLAVEKEFDNFSLRLQLSHPFEDGSGMGFENARDNLYSLYWHNKHEGALLQGLVMEYLYTKHQSGDRSNEQNIPNPKQRGNDNYFNHEIYATGFTHLGQSMGTPLFEPLRYNEQGLVTGVANNRVSALHLGARGNLSQTLSWKTLLTYTRNLGTYVNPYLSVRPQFYSMAQLGWQSPRLPLSLDALMGADIGRLLSDKYGVGCGVRWIF
jgi:hypothetical protein